MASHLHAVTLASERDVVSARQRARIVAEKLGFDHHDQIRIATAVSEIARNAFRYARGGKVFFDADIDARMFRISVVDQGGGIPHLERVLGGSYQSRTGMGMGIVGTKRLMDDFSIQTDSTGTRVNFGKLIPQHRLPDATMLNRLAAELSKQHSATPIEELQVQNRELMKTLDELRERKEELVHINAELQDTNRGVVALYAELDERADYLRRASELKTSFLSNMSHEFRTPLNSMLALSRMLLDRMDGELTAEQEQQIRFIQKSAKELAEMVDDLLDLAKVEAGRLEVKPRTFQVSELFGALRGMLKPLLADSSLNLVFDSSDELPALHTDEQKVSQILRNFISNAIKFTARGEVRVSGSLIDDENIAFSVTDTGIGISELDQRIIFEEFAQVDSAMQRRVKGTGLGLPLSRKLGELLGGRVDVASAIGVGSTFTLQLPITYPGASRPPELRVPVLDPNKQLVLILEDNHETAFVYSRYLSNANFQTHIVSTVEEARIAVLQVRPALMILDILLKSETSWTLLRDIKSDPLTQAIPVIVMSVVDDEHKVYGFGADAFLSKPFSPESLIEVVLSLTTKAIRPRILMIDDNEVSRYLLRGNIPDSLYEVFEARDGREGLRMAAELRPSVIFLDYYMPDFTGVEVLTELRASEVSRDTAVVLHSTKVLDEAEMRFANENHARVFPKQTLSGADGGTRLRELLKALIAHSGEEHSAVA